MGFAGNLRTLSLSEVLQTLARIQATGVLRLASTAGGRDVAFDKGAIIGVAFRSGERAQALLKRLILVGKLDAHSASSLSSAGDEGQVAKAIVEKGWVSADDVTAAYEQQATDELFNIATWDYADFVFEDAGAGHELADQLVERYRKHPIHIDMNHLLIESARRADEWELLARRVPDPRVVYAPGADAEYGLRDMAGEYPGTAVVPLFDGVRTVDDVVAETVATRLDVYSTLVEMLDRRLAQPLGRDELLRNAEHLASVGDHKRAARLYRQLLAGSPDDAALGGALAACLEHLGDVAEAGASWAQIALQHLCSGQAGEAQAVAKRAVELAPELPAARLALVRCLIEANDPGNAVLQLRELAALYSRLGQLEEARGTCLKILELAPADEEARRMLARLFSRGDKDSSGEDAVVCVSCGTVNQREAKVCSQCQAALQLSCLACGRVVGVSDRICIFCGGDPHAGQARREPSSGAGTTARLIKTDRISSEAKKGTAHWREKISKLIEDAHTHEAGGDLERALAAWREVAKWQIDSSELQARIRDLEFRIGDRFIAEQIEIGNRLRKGRRFWRALRGYQRALRSMPNDDPRREPLKQIIAVTTRHQRRNTLVYAAAGALILVLGSLVVQPHLQLRALRPRAEAARAALAALASGGADGVAAASEAVSAIAESAKRVRGKPGAAARALADELAADLTQARAQAARQELDAIAAALDQHDLDRASARIAAFVPAFGADEAPTQLRKLTERADEERKRRLDADLQVKEAPKRLAKAQEREAAGAPAEALALYRSIAAVHDQALAAKGAEGVARLEPQEKTIADAFAAAARSAAKDLRAADAAYAALAPRAAPWGRADDLAARRAEIARRLAASADDYAKLGDKAGIAEFDAFLAAHPGAPEAAQAAARLAVARQQQESRQLALTRYRGLMEQKKWPEAWQAARDLTTAYARTLKPDEVAYPLLIETSPAGASVMLGGHAVGRTPFVLTYLPTQDDEVTLALDGWKPHPFHLRDAAKDWRLQVALARQPRWRAELRKPVTALLPLGDAGAAALTSEAVSVIDAKGAVAWTAQIASEDSLDARARARHQPLALPDGGMAVGQAARGLAVLDRAGRALATYDTGAEVRGRPLLFVNEVFGAQQRLAFAAEALFVGGLGEQPARLPLPAPALAGPLALATDLDRLLIVADQRGHLVAVEDSAKKVAWDIDLQATECGALVSVAPDLLVTVLDGSRVAACHLAPDGAEVRWTQPLGAAAAGDAVLAGGRILVAAGTQVSRFGFDGAPQAPLALPAPAVANVAAAGELTAAACQDGTLVVFRGAERAWTSPLGAPATVLAFRGDQLLVGLADGAVLSFNP